MKKMNYYAVPQPWRMPKWVGFVLGGVFAAIAIGSMVVIVQLTRPPVAAVAAATTAPAAQPAAAAPAVAPTAAAAPAPVAANDTSAPAPTTTHAKKHASSHHKAVRMASAKHAPAQTQTQRNTILAKHDTKDKRHEKDALDKLLGL